MASYGCVNCTGLDPCFLYGPDPRALVEVTWTNRAVQPRTARLSQQSHTRRQRASFWLGLTGKPLAIGLCRSIHQSCFSKRRSGVSIAAHADQQISSVRRLEGHRRRASLICDSASEESHKWRTDRPRRRCGSPRVRTLHRVGALCRVRARPTSVG